MKNAFLLSIVLAAIGGISRLLLQATGREKSATLLQNIVGILLIITLVGGMTGAAFPTLQFSVTENAEKFATLQKDTMAEIIRISEEELAERICARLENTFGVRPNRCNAKIDPQTLSLSEIAISFSAEDTFLSTYAIKKFLREEYGTETEVMFD